MILYIQNARKIIKEKKPSIIKKRDRGDQNSVKSRLKRKKNNPRKKKKFVLKLRYPNYLIFYQLI